MPLLTAVTITRNEEEHVARALRSVQGLADEIVVVDAESTDHTVAVSRQYTDKIFRRPWHGYGPQKNFALQHATGDWVLFVDADEEVPPELAHEIRQKIASCSLPTAHCPDVFFLRIITEFLGKPLTHLWGTNPRLLRRDAVHWDDRAVHEQVVRADGSVVRLGDADVRSLAAALYHPSHYTTLRAYLEKRERYTTRDAEEMLKRGVDRTEKPLPSSFRSPVARLSFLYTRALKQLVRLLFKKRGFLDGWRGLLWIWLSAQYEYMVARKYLRLRPHSAEASRGKPAVGGWQ